MKKIVFSLAIASMFFVAGCAQNKADNKVKKDITKKEIPAKPAHVNASDEEIQKNIGNSVNKDYSVKETDNTKQALGVLAETGNVLKYIDKGKDKKAKQELAKLIGELEIMLTKDPDLALIPVGVAYETNDVTTDLETVQKITLAAKKAMDDGYYQVAKNLMNDLSSELIIKTSYLPMATYPDAMRLSAALLDEGKKEEAVAMLAKSLNTMVIEEQHMPLPVLKAEEFIKMGAATMQKDDKDKKEVAMLFLDNADYQLQLAQAMGYGKKDKEYKELADAIQTLKQSIKDDKESKSGFEKLSKKIKEFKERLFFKKK